MSYILTKTITGNHGLSLITMSAITKVTQWEHSVEPVWRRRTLFLTLKVIRLFKYVHGISNK